MGYIRNIDLSNLPRNPRNRIDWKRSVGLEFYFIYGDVKGKMKIINYNKGKVEIKYKDNTEWMSSDKIVKCQFGKFLKVLHYDFKYKIGENIKDEKRDLTIIDLKYKNDKNDHKQRFCKYHCNKCNNEDWIKESNLDTLQQGCNCCSSKKVVKGYNDIATTDPWMCEYIVNEEDWYKYSKGSNQKVYIKCPYCKTEKYYKISSLNTYHSIGCNCEDNISFSEKFIFKILKDINLDFTWHYSKSDCNWLKNNNKTYDFYFKLNDEEYIIESHGLQHYEYQGRGRTLEEEQTNDQYKYNLAIQNGIKPENYIVIDFRKSTLEWGKEHILNSRLAEIFDLSSINWEECEEYALKNIVKEVCDYWHEHKEINREEVTTTLLMHIFKLSTNTIRKYLKKGTKIGWCNYNPKNELKSNRSKSGRVLGKTVICVETGEEFYSIEQAGRVMKIDSECIRLCCHKKQKSTHGFHFVFK